MNGIIFKIIKVKQNDKYFLAIYILSGIVNSNFSINISGIILIICGILAGMLGGIVGVNIKKWKK